jgi:hypothetical protein
MLPALKADNLNLGCLHPVARVVSYDVGFNPSTQRHYHRFVGAFHGNLPHVTQTGIQETTQ